MVKRDTIETYDYTFEMMEKRCKEISEEILANPEIKNIYGIPRGGVIPAMRIVYLTGLPLTNEPNVMHTAMIDDCIDSGATRARFEFFDNFFVLIDRTKEKIDAWLEFWWEVDQHDKD